MVHFEVSKKIQVSVKGPLSPGGWETLIQYMILNSKCLKISNTCTHQENCCNGFAHPMECDKWKSRFCSKFLLEISIWNSNLRRNKCEGKCQPCLKFSNDVIKCKILPNRSKLTFTSRRVKNPKMQQFENSNN